MSILLAARESGGRLRLLRPALSPESYTLEGF